MEHLARIGIAFGPRSPGTIGVHVGVAQGIDNADGLTLYYRTTGTLAWTEGDGTVGVTVAADGLFTMPATTQLLWGTLGGTGGIVKENR